MTEIFENVRDEVKHIAEGSWFIAISMNNPMAAAEFLQSVIDYYTHSYTEEEIEFLQFYFKMKMEMMKE